MLFSGDALLLTGNKKKERQCQIKQPVLTTFYITVQIAFY